jgi:4'-phosphopantetheinyl transferase
MQLGAGLAAKQRNNAAHGTSRGTATEDEGAPPGRKKPAMKIDWLEQREAEVPYENCWMSRNELDRLAAMRVPKRRADWRLGRWTAKLAIASFLHFRLDLPALADIEIRAASSGAPEAFLHNEPAPVSISLSHSSATALCAIAALGGKFGCDLETIEPRDDAFIADYFTTEEKSIVDRSSIEDRPLLVALLWSAKESALKALRVGLRLPTTSVSVQFSEGYPPPGQRPRSPVRSGAEEWSALSVRYSADQMFTGYWRAEGNLVRTVVCDAPQFTLRQSPFVETLLTTPF